MNNNFFMLKEKYNIDIFTDFILHNDDTFYFYLDLNEDTLFNAQFHQIKGDFPIALKTENKLNLNEMFNHINKRCERIEVWGEEKFLASLHSDLNKVFEGEKARVVFPLKIDNNPYFLEVKILYFKESNIVVGTFLDVTEESKISEELYVKSYKDILTGLFNRNTCMFHLRTIPKNSNKHIIMIDLNSFKLVNDIYGHNKGDEVLHNFGQNLKNLANEKIIFYRLAGDEFICQTTDMSLKEVIELSKQINECAKNTSFLDMKISASIGIIKVEDDMDESDILRYVDFAMYEAKRTPNKFYSYLDRAELKLIEKRLH